METEIFAALQGFVDRFAGIVRTIKEAVGGAALGAALFARKKDGYGNPLAGDAAATFRRIRPQHRQPADGRNYRSRRCSGSFMGFLHGTIRPAVRQRRGRSRIPGLTFLLRGGAGHPARQRTGLDGPGRPARRRRERSGDAAAITPGTGAARSGSCAGTRPQFPGFPGVFAGRALRCGKDASAGAAGPRAEHAAR